MKRNKEGRLRDPLLRGAFGVGGLRMLSLPLTLLLSVLLARALGPEGYGRYSFAIAVITILALPVTSGLGQLVTREVAMCQQTERWRLLRGLLRRSHQWVLLASALIAVSALWVLREWGGTQDIGMAFWAITVLLLPLLGLNALRSGILRGLRLVVWSRIPEFIVMPGSQFLLL
ncbi:MAG: oligosaccharide flippase family protein, partial [Pseudomonadota bacterium]